MEIILTTSLYIFKWSDQYTNNDGKQNKNIHYDNLFKYFHPHNILFSLVLSTCNSESESISYHLLKACFLKPVYADNYLS